MQCDEPSLAIAWVDPDAAAADLTLRPNELAAWWPSLAGSAPAAVRVHGLAAWPAGARWQLFGLIAGLSGAPALEIDGQRGSDLFELMVTQQPGPSAPLATRARLQEAAIEAAAWLYPATPELAAARLGEALAAIGETKPDAGALRRRLAGLAAWTQGPAADDPLAIARAYEAACREGAEVGEAEPVLLNQRNRWLLWDGQHWQGLSQAQLRERLGRFVASKELARPSPALLDQAIAWLRYRHMLEPAGAAPPLTITAADPLTVEPGRFLAVANGRLDLEALEREGEVAWRERTHRHVPAATLPVAYDPEAGCDAWERFIQEALPPTEAGDRRQQVLREFMAYLLIDRCHLETMLILEGDGANGKSVILRVIEALLGGAHVSHLDLDELNDPIRLAKLEGKLANLTCELSPGQRIAERALKRLVSGEPIKADARYHDPWTIQPRAKLIAAGNGLPQFTEAATGLWRRLLVLPMDRRFDGEGADPDLASRIVEEELPGVLNWALKAAPGLVKRARFTNCSRCERAKASHRRDCDSVRQFAEQCLRQAPNTVIERNAVYTAYCRFARQLGPNEKPVGRAEFGKRLLRLPGIADGGRSSPMDGGYRPWLYKGICLGPEGHDLL
jgi:P4 family phage/plasmid primase-like protien